jgi:osmotically-inducible protein OsmY
MKKFLVGLLTFLIINSNSAYSYEAKENNSSYNVRDAEITALLKSKFETDKITKKIDKHIITINGKVIIMAYVPNVEIKEHFINITRSIKEVKEVDAELIEIDKF